MDLKINLIIYAIQRMGTKCIVGIEVPEGKHTCGSAEAKMQMPRAPKI